MDQAEFSREILCKNILSQKWQNTLTQIFYVLVHKESESGLLYNERMLVLEQHTFTFFYSKMTRPLPQLLQAHQKGLCVFKERLSVINATVNRNQNIISLHFRTDKIKRIWTFKFTSNSLAEKWAFLFAEVQEKCLTRSLKSRETGSTSHKSESLENYTSILSNKPTQQKAPSPNQEEYESRRKKLAIQKLQ